ncbi:MAG: sugar phosphate isomerase/epimerase [Armatimonadetes bacterium]|jgi:sugar phosphate isomerase/epimerase|nr:sugar phosphate isomerase/epimerase [Armatimonadota bacterium]
MKHELLSRRRLLGAGITSAVAPLFSPLLLAPGAAVAAEAPGDSWRGLKLGVASYTLRKLPLDACITAIKRAGLKYVSIKDFHLPLTSSPEERKAVAGKFRDAGITPLSCGVITTKNDEANVRAAFEYARDAGIPTIVGAPDPASLPILDRMVKEFDIRVAIHNHGPEDKRFPSPYDVWKAVQPFDKRIGLCIDVGHTRRAGVDPAEAILKTRERLYDIHLKDVSSSEPSGKPVKGGRGVLDLPSIMSALLEIRFPHLIGIEYEEDADDPLPGLFETIGYVRGVMLKMKA